MYVQTTTWKDKIADSSNSWLRAMTAEEDGRLPEATVLYLADATDCLGRGLKARAALSCGCAAACLERMGNVNAGRHLYLEAAKIYEEQGDAAMESSLREALWLLQEAHDYFVMGSDVDNAARIYDRCASLAMKLNPFVTTDTLDGMLRIKPDAQARPTFFSIPAPEPREVSLAIDQFLRLRETQRGSSESRQPEKSPPQGNPKRDSVEKSVVG
jgi:hypothetical protein